MKDVVLLVEDDEQASKTISLNGNKVNLGKTPLEILKLLVNNRRKVLSKISL